MKLVLSHLNGNANVRAAANGFIEAGILNRFYTSIAVFPDSMLARGLVPAKYFSKLKHREFDSILKPYTQTWPWLEMFRLMVKAGPLKKLSTKNTNPFHLDAVNRNIDKYVASKLKHEAALNAKAVYCYEDTALFSFRKAKELGLTCLYELPIGYWREGNRLLEIEKHRWPDWIPTMNNFTLSEYDLCRKDEEIKLADRIYVASSFVADTLQSFADVLPPVEVIPYGFPPALNNYRTYSNVNRKQPLKLLYVGILTQRKGIANLFAAVEKLRPHVTLTVVGCQQTTNNCPALNTELAKHDWFPQLTNENVLKLMREHDVLVFPSLFEGFGLVITEAMSQGLPVITTERTGGKDIIADTENGWLIEAGSTETIHLAIEKVLLQPQQLKKVGRAALETARMRPWYHYGKELAHSVRKQLH